MVPLIDKAVANEDRVGECGGSVGDLVISRSPLVLPRRREERKESELPEVEATGPSVDCATLVDRLGEDACRSSRGTITLLGEARVRECIDGGDEGATNVVPVEAAECCS